jgi:RNA polymerase sigma-70 factor (ECF subfamily)
LLTTTIYEERALLGRIAGGDEAAFRQLFHSYNKVLQPFVFKLTRSQDAAEEVLQEVFLKIWLHREKLTGVENPKAYIVRIVSNECLDYLQASAKNDRLVEALRRSPAPDYPCPEQSLSYRETERRIHDAIDQLPLARRQIYRMSREQYKRIPEIANELNLSNSTVKNQLVKALKSIRLHIGNIVPAMIFFFLFR